MVGVVFEPVGRTSCAGADRLTHVHSIGTQTNLFGWSRLSNPQRFEAYNRWSFYFMLGCVPLGALLVLTGAAPWSATSAGTYLLVMVAHTVICLLTFAHSFDYILGRRPLPRRLLQLMAGWIVVVLAVLAVVFPGLSPEFPGMISFPVVLLLLSSLVAVCPLINAWYVALASVLIALVTGAFTALTGELGFAIFGVFYALLFSVTLGLTLRISIWTVLVVWEQERRREVDARLAVAEERLRFSRDLHDVFGRTLSTVAVKSELAAALAERGDPRGAEEMMLVRGLAQDALKEVREVVQGYRATDLATELAGAREILSASGIEVRMAGEGLELPGPVQEALAWTVREGVTNVVRHSAANECTIEVRQEVDSYRVRISNDGVRGVPSRSGNGLRGLAERLALVGGGLQVLPTEDTEFTIEAQVPADVQVGSGMQVDTGEET